ncbi:Uncharacterized membrane protein, DUF4010 family [Salinihabitans flavidus]|uniref:Uncharacterized membrane protein, DUF4010 family n=1 Tax=Salinihabitans flavidus TaxID=569882 RepID=A0A1H8PT90_9RHOB|nr:MgtC/SapB family protein [Salinihabitans flavidus]SEO45170.1 Uncharacterized membrane protein, DUF4010 family [Salinihabitans flavidus]
MEDTDLYQRLAMAVAIGLLFGLERGWHGRNEAEGDRMAGIRTFALTGLFGGVCGWLSLILGEIFLGIALFGVCVLVGLSYWTRLRKQNDIGMTTEIALLLAFGLGAASVVAEVAPAATAAVAAASLLATKDILHRWLTKIREYELYAALQLAVISVVILPLLPDQGYGPGGVLNPYELWWAVVVVAGLSFFGYLAIRVAGARLGILITGLFGGMASSTSTTLAFSRMARDDTKLRPILAVGVVVAGSVTCLRILAVSAIFERSLIPSLAPPMVLMAMIGFTGAVVLKLLADHEGGAPSELEELSNPLALRTALSFGVILSVVVLITHFLRDWFGTGGIYAAAGFSGIADVDALTISVSRMAGEDLAIVTATGAIVLAVSVNTAVKGGIALVFASGGGFGLRIMGIYALMIAVGAIFVFRGLS